LIILYLLGTAEADISAFRRKFRDNLRITTTTWTGNTFQERISSDVSNKPGGSQKDMFTFETFEENEFFDFLEAIFGKFRPCSRNRPQVYVLDFSKRLLA